MWPRDAIRTLNGGPGRWFVHKGEYEETEWSDGTILYTAQQVFDKILECDTKRAIMVAYNDLPS